MTSAIGITLKMPSEMVSVKKWARLARRSKIPFSLPDPIGGEWFVQSIETQSIEYSAFQRMTTIVLIPVIRTKGKKKR